MMTVVMHFASVVGGDVILDGPEEYLIEKGDEHGRVEILGRRWHMWH